MSDGIGVIRAYRERTGASYEEVAQLLSDNLGRTITPGGVEKFENHRKIYKSWAGVLGADDDTAPLLDAEADTDIPPGESFVRDVGDPPRPPTGARTVPSPSSSGGGEGYAFAKERIAQLYGAIGAGVSMGTRNDGYAAAMDLYKEDIAKAWIAAARENKHVAAVVKFMESGGAVGELVFCHLILVGGFVYVSGRAPQLSTVYGRHLGPYHGAAAHQRASESADDGAGTNGQPHPMADRPQAPSD